MTGRATLVSVIVPARNEEPDIAACIEAIGAQDHPLDRLEVLVVDGASSDGTTAVAEQALARHPFGAARVLRSEGGSTPGNLNAGLGAATGDVVCRVDARSVIEPHHVRTCVAVLADRPDVVVVGGGQRALPRDRSARSVGIARALNNPYAMGLSRYRRNASSGPSDTVYLGAFRTGDLRAVGGWDERLPTNQDFDLNRRLAARGTVWFESSLHTGYLPRRSLSELWAQYRRFGRWKVRYWRTTGDRPRPRQLVLLASSLLLPLCLVALGRRSGRVAALAGAVAMAAVDEVGSRERAPLAVRSVAAAAMCVVAAGWAGGVWTELVRPAPTSPGGA